SLVDAVPGRRHLARPVRLAGHRKPRTRLRPRPAIVATRTHALSPAAFRRDPHARAAHAARVVVRALAVTGTRRRDLPHAPRAGSPVVSTLSAALRTVHAPRTRPAGRFRGRQTHCVTAFPRRL